MVLSRLVHLSVDAALLTTLLAGVKRTSGFGLSPETFLPENEQALSVANKYLAFGEVVFDYACASAYTSKYFQRSEVSNGPNK